MTNLQRCGQDLSLSGRPLSNGLLRWARAEGLRSLLLAIAPEAFHTGLIFISSSERNGSRQAATLIMAEADTEHQTRTSNNKRDLV